MSVLSFSQAQRRRQERRDGAGRYAAMPRAEAQVELDGADPRLSESLQGLDPDLAHQLRDAWTGAQDRHLDELAAGRLAPWSVLSGRDLDELVIDPRPGAVPRAEAARLRYQVSQARSLSHALAVGAEVEDEMFESMHLDPAHAPPAAQIGPQDRPLVDAMVSGQGPSVARRLYRIHRGHTDQTAPSYWSDPATAPTGLHTVQDRAREDLRRMEAVQFLAESGRQAQADKMTALAADQTERERQKWEAGWPGPGQAPRPVVRSLD